MEADDDVTQHDEDPPIWMGWDVKNGADDEKANLDPHNEPYEEQRRYYRQLYGSREKRNP